MKRNIERRISCLGRLDDELCRLVEPRQINLEIRQLVPQRQHHLRALAHGGSAEQTMGGSLLRHDQYFSSGLPDVLMSSGFSGSGV